jgi:IS1 family transposase
MPATELEVVEMDEGHLYVGSKKHMLAVDCRTGKRFINVVIGDRSTDTGQCLWEGGASSQHRSSDDRLLATLSTLYSA